MKIVRYQLGDGEPVHGILEDGGAILRLEGSLFGEFHAGAKVAQLDGVRVLAPVQPAKTICVGLNYVTHIQETGHATPPFPMLFFKPATAIVGQGDAIVYPMRGERVDYEAELAVVIGKTARRVGEGQALDYVLGYTCGNDVSERVIQRAEMAMGAISVSKGFDTFNPMGPVIATGLDPTNLGVKGTLNGEVRQDSNTSDLLFGVAHLIEYISDAMTLLPGDVIMTGTPGGIGPMTPGDVFEVEIEGIGVLRNPVVADE